MARPKNPKGNTTSRRYTGGRPRESVDVAIGKAAMKTLTTLARAAGVSVEAKAAQLLTAAIEDAWNAYDREIGEAAEQAWEGEIL